MKLVKIIGVSALALMPLFASARHLTSAEALDAARLQPAKVRSASSTLDYDLHLAYTVDDAIGQEAVYVFNSASRPVGFVVLAADDAIGNIVLGYSDDSSFNPSDMPPQMNWWLERYAQIVEAVSERAIPLKAPSKASRAAIAPICKTQWNQGAPFNNQCPTLSGTKTPTGCVATAMAQVMKVNQWPTTGTGTYSYTFTYNNKNYSGSFDFGNTTFDWNNMLNSYNGSYTTTQGNAVATLMRACGVAANMSYAPDGSGALDIDAAAGLIRNLGYDKGIRYVAEEWFTNSQWDDIFYNELSLNRPIMIGASNNRNEGHEFVCDGYSDGYYHINWGWGGVADGYFTIDNLNPDEVGIGGGSGDGSFNNNMSILLDVRRPVAGSSIYPTLWMQDDFATDKTSYSRSSNSAMYISTTAFSFAVMTMDMTLGLQLTKDDGTVTYVEVGAINGIEPLQGFANVGLYTKNIPVGEYDVTFATKGSDDVWHPAYYDVPTTTGVKHFSVTSSSISVSDAVGQPDTSEEVTLEANLVGYTKDNPSDAGFYPGHTYNFYFDITASADYSTYMLVAIFNSAGNILCYGSVDPYEFTANETQRVVFPLTIASSITPGDYYFGLIDYPEDDLNLVVAYNITIQSEQTGVEAVEIENGDNAVYFDLQGHRLTEPSSNGLIIRMDNGKAQKVIVK